MDIRPDESPPQGWKSFLQVLICALVGQVSINSSSSVVAKRVTLSKVIRLLELIAILAGFFECLVKERFGGLIQSDGQFFVCQVIELPVRMAPTEEFQELAI